MPGYLYVFGLMTAGLLSVLLLALRTEKTCCRAVEEALAKIPGLNAGDRLFAGRRGLAVDRRHRALCLICAETETVRLHVVPFTDLLACELMVGGQVIARADCRGGSLPAPGPEVAGGEGVRLRLHVADHYAPRHELHLEELSEGLRWQAELGLLLRRAARERSAAPPSTPAPAAAPRRGAADSQAPDLKSALRRYLARELGSQERLVIAERRLRDCCAAGVPLIRFHEQMNRLRRSKALGDYCLSYSRKGEVWRISRRESRKAA